jgi:hypothetical protein
MSEEDDEPSRFPYREAIGYFNYVSSLKRPDISFAVNKAAAKYCEDSKPAHWNAVKRIRRYLKSTIDYGL